MQRIGAYLYSFPRCALARCSRKTTDLVPGAIGGFVVLARV
jgi:hypothetical protein